MDAHLQDADKKVPSKPFEDATPLLKDAKALREKADTSGFLFFKGLLKRDKVLHLRKEIFEILNRRGWLDRSQPLIEGKADLKAIKNLSKEELNWNGVGVPEEVYLEVQKLESFHGLAHDPKLLEVYNILFDSEPFPHPRNIGRLMLPSDKLKKTPSHQDFLHVQGAQNTWTCWIPVGDCPMELGGLSILEGSHKAGLLGVTNKPGAGGLESILCGLGYEWAAGNYDAGDFVTFHSHTVHKAMPNLLVDQIRLSCDFRYQPINQPIEERSLLPHGPYEWDEIYREWNRDDLKFYWKNYQMERSPWDEKIRWQKDKIC
jgi:hypothetical protein